jgi:hypothetical protein
MGEWDLRTVLGQAADFLEKGLQFDVTPDDGALSCVLHRTSGAAVRYVLRGETENSVNERRSADYFKVFRPVGGIQTKGCIVFTEELLGAAQEYQQRLADAELRSLSPLALSATKTALRSRELILQAVEEGVQVLTLPAFLRTFVDVGRLRARSLPPVSERGNYVEPRLLVGGIETSVESLLDEVILPKRGERLVVVHAPGGRGKTALCEHIAGELFKRTENSRVPIPFLIKFEDHRSVTGLNVLIHDALRQYGLHLDLGPEAVDRLIRYGVFILVFDGFDELSERAGEQVRRRNIQEFAPKIHQDTAGRAILTCRSTFLTMFPKLLQEVEREAQGHLLLVEVQQLAPHQVRDYLVLNPPSGVSPLRHRDRVLTFLDEEPRLWELAQEPLTLGMISELIGAAKYELPSNLAGVYDHFVSLACDRDRERHNLPTELPQRQFLAAVASDMLELGQFALERYWVEAIAHDILNETTQSWSEEEKGELTVRLVDHYMFAPETLAAAADIKFRHTGFRDFLIAWRLSDAMARVREFEELLGTIEFPLEVLNFLADFLHEADKARLAAAASRTTRVGTRNLVRLVGLWNAGRHFRDVYPPPLGLRDKAVDGLVLDGLDLQGYRWERVSAQSATFRDCDLTGAALGNAAWAELRVDQCTLTGADLGDHKDRTIVIDGVTLLGEDLCQALIRYGAQGPGVREFQAVPATEDRVLGILSEIFRKVVVGDRRETSRFLNVRPDTFLRGKLLADPRNRMLVRDVALPAARRKWPAGGEREIPYIGPSGDRHGTLTLDPDRASEVLDFLWQGKLSDSLSKLLEHVRSRS